MHISGLITIRVQCRVTSMQTGSQDETDLQLTGSVYAAILYWYWQYLRNTKQKTTGHVGDSLMLENNC